MTGIRYAIKMPDGTYSNGPRMEPVPLNKAKLWTNIGHVKNHIQKVYGKYPAGTEIVSVVLEYREQIVGSVEEYLSDVLKTQRKQRLETEKRHAQRELEAAKERLAKAKKRAAELNEFRRAHFMEDDD